MRNNYHVQPQSEDSVTKISRSKSRNQISIVSKNKEKVRVGISKESGWNQRFHLEHIPQYNYQNEPHSQYLKNKFKIPNKKNERNDLSKAKRGYEASLDKNKVSNKPNLRKNEERQKEAINKAFTDLKSMWYQKNIPECHMEIMTKIFNSENNPMKILEDIKHQFSQISKQTSLVQKIMNSIESREVCLEKINELIKQLQNQEISQAKVAKLFEQKIGHLRFLTIHCIQCIYQWKQSIEPLIFKNIKIKYSVNGKSYIQKIIDDYKMISTSKLKDIFGFDTKKLDVFFINYTLEGKKISSIPKSNIKRIRFIEIMLNENQNKEDQNQDQQSQRTPIIHKMRSPPINRQDKSLPPKGIQADLQKWKKFEVEYGDISDYFTASVSKSPFNLSFLSTIEIPRYQELTIFQNGEMNEEVILGVDRNSTQRKIILLNIKSTLQNVDSGLKSLCEYLWEHDNCNQIRVSLVHHKFGEGISVDVQLQKKLKIVGFRWVSVNQSNEARMTIYGIKRPLNAVAHKTARRRQAYPMIVEHLTILSLAESNQKKMSNRCPASVFTLIELLRDLKRQEYEQICKRDQFSHHLDCINRIIAYNTQQAKRNGITEGFQKSFTYSGLRAFQVDSIDTVGKIFRNIQISDKKVPHLFPNYISLMNSSFKFKNTTISHEKYTKFLPNKDNEILICESNYPIYLLQSDEENINFFIIEVDETFSMESIDSIFHAMGEQSSFIDDFWLPIFHKSMDYIDEVGLKNTEIISTDYWSCLGSLKRKGNKKRTKIIKPPFVFGLINKKLLQMLEVPFYCTLVRKEDLV